MAERRLLSETGQRNVPSRMSASDENFDTSQLVSDVSDVKPVSQ